MCSQQKRSTSFNTINTYQNRTYTIQSSLITSDELQNMNPSSQIRRELMKLVCKVEFFPVSHLSISNSLCFLCPYALICAKWLLENNQTLLHGKIRSYVSISFHNMFILVFSISTYRNPLALVMQDPPIPCPFYSFFPARFPSFWHLVDGFNGAWDVWKLPGAAADRNWVWLPRRIISTLNITCRWWFQTILEKC